jgi:hypothetical protein
MCHPNKTALFLVAMLTGLNLAASADWKLKAGFEAGWRYDTNIFNLSPSQISSLRAPGPGDILSGRFRDMASPGDHIVQPTFSLALEGRGLFREKLAIRASAQYEVYARSSRRNNLEAELGLKQDLGRRASIKIGARYLPKYFRKNFLLDAIAGATGQVLPEDRIYAAGIYREEELQAGWEYRLLTRKQTKAFSLTAEIDGWIGRRTYETFRGRDRDILGFQGAAVFGLGGGTELVGGYGHERSQSPIVSEVLVLDEPMFGVDFNADGDLLDDNVRVVSAVDRSFRTDEFFARLNVAPAKGTRLGFRVSRTLRHFLSTEPHDGYSGRTNRRWTFRADLERKISDHWSLFAGYAYTNQKIDRIDVTEDEADYAKHVARAGIAWRF